MRVRGFAIALVCSGAPLAALAADHTVYFALDSARLSSEGSSIVSAAAADYVATGETAVSLVGHADASGAADYNEDLSRRRAESVVAALVAAGVPGSAITAAWRGEADPAVQTADGAVEPLNRRVEISVSQPVLPTAPEPIAQTLSRIAIGLGPYVGYNMQDGDESVFLGGNLTATYFATPNVALTGETALFWNLDAEDEGLGFRGAVGGDYYFSEYGLGGGVLPYVGVNAGYMTIDGSGKGGFFAGPEVGLSIFGVNAKLAYDIVEDRDLEEGVISLTLAYDFRF